MCLRLNPFPERTKISFMTEEEDADKLEQQRQYEEKLRDYEEQLELYKQSEVTAKENRKIAEQEYDKLVIYLAGGGLVLTIGFVKDILKITEATNIVLLLVCWICFAACLLANLLSHSLSVSTADSFLAGSADWQKKDRRVVWANRACFWLVFLGIATFIGFILQNIPYHAQSDKSRQPGIHNAQPRDSTERTDPRSKRREQAAPARSRDSTRH
jgi:hypothetical protein